MSYPITPSPSVHNLPAALAKREALDSARRVENLATGLVNAIASQVLSWLTGGLVTPGQVEDALKQMEAWGARFSAFLANNFLDPLLTVEHAAENFINSVLAPTGIFALGDDLRLLINAALGGITHTAADLGKFIAAVQKAAQGTINAIHRALGAAADGQSADTVVALLQNIPHGNVIPLPNPAASVTFDAAGSWSPNTTTTTSGAATVTGTHTLGTNGTCALVVVTFEGSSFDAADYTVTADFGTTMTCLNSCFSNPGSGVVLWSMLFGLFNPSGGAPSVSVTPLNGESVYSVAAESASYCGVSEIDNAFSGSGTGSLSLSISSATNNIAVGIFSAMSTTGSSTTIGSYSGSSRGNSGNVYNSSALPFALVLGDAPGSGSPVGITATATGSGTVWRNAMSVNLVNNPAVSIGSGFRAIHTGSSASFAPTVSSAANSGFFDTQHAASTSDYIWDSSTGTVTVTQAGWYSVKILYGLDSGMSESFAFSPVLITSATGFGEVGSSAYYPASAGAEIISSDTFYLYCDVGDTIQAGYASSKSSNATVVDGRFSVTLDNRSNL